MNLTDLVDMRKLQELCESFTALTGAVTAILDLEGKVLVATGWRSICTRFHRVHDVTAARCQESDTVLAGQLDRREPYNVYRCRNGLVDVAMPIIIDGEHVGNFFTGQFFLEPPDRDYFIDQGEGFGFDRSDYLAALDEVPLFSEAQVKALVDFFGRLTQMFGEMGLNQKRLEEVNTLHQQSEEKFARAFARAPVLMAISKLEDGTFIDVNDKFCEVTGYSRDEVIGNTGVTLGLLTPEIRQQLAQEMQQNGHLTNFELPMTAKGGRQLTVVFCGQILHLEGQARVLATAVDLTDQKKLESDLRQSQKMESVGRLAGGIAHDFNNKLMVVLGHAELAARACPENEQMQEHLHEILRAAQASRDLIQQLLAFSRRQLISPRPVDVNACIESASKSLARLIGEDVQLLFEPCDRPWTVLVDPVQLDQTIMNLAVNARDAMPDGGVIRITTENVQIDAATAHAHKIARPGPYVRIVVRDNGHGMDADTLQHVFEPFYTTKDHGKGTGLGLATVYGIVTQNKGFVEVFSEPHQGTEFRVHLPRHGSSRPVEEAKETRTLSGSGLVLLVEDEDSVRKLTASMLKRIGYTVVQAASPDEALQIVASKRHAIEFVLTDVVMPGMTGRELARRLASTLPGVPIVFMTGYSMLRGESLGRENELLLHKPFSLETLDQVLKKACEVGACRVSPAGAT